MSLALLRECAAAFGRAAGFERYGDAWCKQVGNFVCEFDVDQSTQINLGFWVGREMSAPPDDDVVRLPLEHFLSREDAREFAVALDPDTGIDENGRMFRLLAVLFRTLPVTFEGATSPEDLRRVGADRSTGRRVAPGVPFGERVAAADADPVRRTVTAFCSAAGFIGRSRTWHRLYDDVTVSLNLEKSPYGAAYYLNVGFTIHALSAKQKPTASNFGVALRFEELCRSEGRTMEQLLDLDRPFDENDRSVRLLTLLDRDLRPVLDRGSTVAGLRAMLADRTIPGYVVVGAYVEALGKRPAVR